MVTGPKKTRFDRVSISIAEFHQDVAHDRGPKIVSAFELQYNCRSLPSGPFKKLCGCPPLSSRSSFGDLWGTTLPAEDTDKCHKILLLAGRHPDRAAVVKEGK